MTRRHAAVLAAALAIGPAVPLAAVLNDEVTSAKLKEADNTGSQDTNGGSGVKTGHLQNRAVTGAKIADGTITATQLATGAVTDAKIAGPISTAKLNVGTGAGTVAAGNHAHDGLYQRKHANVIVVARSGGDFASPDAALGSIADASPTNPYLVKIMPGVYDVSASPLVIPSHVTVEGAGPRATKLLGWVQCLSSTTLRALSVENSTWHGVEVRAEDVVLSDLEIAGTHAGLYIDGGYRLRIESVRVTESSAGFDHAAILNANSNEVTMRDVVAQVGGPDYGGTSVGVHNWYAVGTVMENVTVVATSGGSSVYGILNFLTTNVRVANSTVKVAGPYSAWAVSNGGTGSTFEGVTVAGDGAAGGYCVTFQNVGGPVTIDHSRLAGTCPVALDGSGVLLGASRVDGPIVAGAVTKCVGSYGPGYEPLTCP